jgi:hypothetical protein
MRQNVDVVAAAAAEAERKECSVSSRSKKKKKYLAWERRIWSIFPGWLFGFECVGGQTQIVRLGAVTFVVRVA